MANSLDLGQIFQSVASALSSQQNDLNDSDEYNHDHGDHMVQIFDLIQSAVSKKSDKPVSEQLAYASKVVEKEATSGSGKLYAEGLANAAANFKGTDLNVNNIGSLVQSLMNVSQSQQTSQDNNCNMLGSLLSGLTGDQNNAEADNSLGLDDLFRVGMKFYQSKQDGENSGEAIMDALMAASPMGQSAHRSQSGSIVVSTIMQFAQSLKDK